MLSMQSRTKKSTLVLLGCLALAGLASCSGGGGSGGSKDPGMIIYPPPENRAPEAVGSIPGQTVAVGSTRTLDVGRYFRDADGDRLTYRVASGDASVATVVVSGSAVTIRGHTAGTATVRVTARDPGGLSAYQDFTVRVEAVQQNAPPLARGSIPGQTVVEGDTETLDVERYFTDPDGDRLSYSVASGDASVAMATVSGSVVTIRGRTAGTATVRVTARDPGGLSAYQDFTVRVQADRVQADPLDDVSVTIPSQCPREVQVCVRDHQCEDGDVVRVSVNGARLFERELFNAPYCVSVPVREGTNSIELFAVNGTGFRGNCDHSDVNTGEISINGGAQRWEHSGGRGSRANLNVNIGPPGGRCFSTGSPGERNRPPSIVGNIPDITLTVGENETVNLSSYFTDPDGDSLRYTRTLSSGQENNLNVTVSGNNLRIRALAAPGATIRVTARDPGGLTVYQDFTVRVEAVSQNDPVVVYPVEDGCNDGYRVNYRFFEFHPTTNKQTGVWPSAGEISYTPGFEREVTNRLSGCTPGSNVCLGAELSDSYWGVGIDGDRSCANCCVRCPISGEARVRTFGFGCPSG